jgi:hypothetical protein
MNIFNEDDLIQFWKDANSYQSIDVSCFDIEEFKNNWVRDKIGYESLENTIKPLTFKGFIGVFSWKEGEQQYCGKIANIDDLVTFIGETKFDLHDSFKEAVNDYIELCRKVNKKPIFKD